MTVDDGIKIAFGVAFIICVALTWIIEDIINFDDREVKEYMRTGYIMCPAGKEIQPYIDEIRYAEVVFNEADPKDENAVEIAFFSLRGAYTDFGKAYMKLKNETPASEERTNHEELK